MSLPGCKKISFIIPCLNEEYSLPILLAGIPNYIDEVIVVDNGSTDKSVEAARKYSVRVVEENIRGYGSAILKGIYCANGDILALMDGDASYFIKDLEKAINLLENDKLDFVSGCRFPLMGDHRAMPWVNKIANHFASWFIGILFKINIKDSQSGLMVFRKEFFDRLKIENKGMGFSQELKIKAWLARGAKCAETHIDYGVRIGKSKFQKLPDGLKNLFSLWSIFIKRTKENVAC